MRNGHLAFWTLAVVTYVISLFFWPTPAVPLIGAVLIPVAIRAGLRRWRVGMVVAIAGQGMALSSDYIIRVAPGLSAKAAGADPDTVADRALVLSLIVGGIALVIGYAMQVRQDAQAVRRVARRLGDRCRRAHVETRRGRRRAPARSRPGGARGLGARPMATAAERRAPWSARGVGATPDPAAAGRAPIVGHGWRCGARRPGSRVPARTHVPRSSKPLASTVFAVLVPLAYLALIIYLVVSAGLGLGAGPQGRRRRGVRRWHRAADPVRRRVRQATARSFLETVAEHVVDGLVFAFKAMGVVLPIAGFFFIGNGDFSGQILGLAERRQGPGVPVRPRQRRPGALARRTR